MNDTKIKVCVPYYSEYETVKSGIDSVRRAGINFDFVAAQGPYIAQARNALINSESSQAISQDIGSDYSHFLFVDSDIGFDYSHVKALIGMDRGVSCCPYLRHGSETVYQVGLFSEPGLIKERFTNERKGIQVVDWCGGGFLLVRSKIFSQLPYPWFRYGILEKDGMAELLSEDICFSMALNNAGINIWCNFDYPVFHKPRKADYKT